MWKILLNILLLQCLVASGSTHAEVGWIINLPQSHGILQLNDTTFERLTRPSREWGLTVVLTAIPPEYQCEPCWQFEAPFREVAQAWRRVRRKEDREKHFFAMLDYGNGSDTFQKFNVESAPALWTYPHPSLSTARAKPYVYEFKRGIAPLVVARDLSAHTPVPIPFRLPLLERYPWLTSFSPKKAFVTSFLLTSATTLLYISPRWTLATATLLWIAAMTGGAMFVNIRESRLQGYRGEWVFAEGGRPHSQSQYGMEIVLIAGLYLLLSLSHISQIYGVLKIRGKIVQNLVIYSILATQVTLFAALVAIFRRKSPWYPFRFLL